MKHAPCPVHTWLLLPLWTDCEGMCPVCAQEARAASYARDRDAFRVRRAIRELEALAATRKQAGPEKPSRVAGPQHLTTENIRPRDAEATRMHGLPPGHIGAGVTTGARDLAVSPGV